MKPVAEWTEADLLALIGQDETSNLEFKRSDALANNQPNKAELAKDVSAMANAAGGVIVYGIAEVNHVADHVDEGSTQTKEWIDQVLASNIEPRVAGVIIQRVTLSNNNFTFAIEVPQAVAFAPHMSKPHHRYFTRRNVTTDALLDHEVRDLMRRHAPFPDIELRHELIFAGQLTSGGIEARSLHIELSLISNKCPARAAYLHLLGPSVAKIVDAPYAYVEKTKYGPEERFEARSDKLFHVDLPYPVCRLEVRAAQPNVNQPFLVNMQPVRSTLVEIRYRIGAEGCPATIGILEISGRDITDFLGLA